jgi:hypothetical protein
MMQEREERIRQLELVQAQTAEQNEKQKSGLIQQIVKLREQNKAIQDNILKTQQAQKGNSRTNESRKC